MPTTKRTQAIVGLAVSAAGGGVLTLVSGSLIPAIVGAAVAVPAFWLYLRLTRAENEWPDSDDVSE